MTDLEREWAELTTGVYIHRWQPRLLIVRRQIFHALSLPDDLSPCEWDDVCAQIWYTAQVSWEEVRNAGIRWQDVEILEEAKDYAG